MSTHAPTRPRRDERGASMIFTLLSLAMVTVLGLTLTSVGMSTMAMATAESETTEALAIAAAGIEHGKQLILYQDWQSLNVFLQRGDAAACSWDELADVPVGALPAGYPASGSGQFIPSAGRAFAQGTYYVQLCDNHAAESAAATPDVDPNTDVDKIIKMRSVGLGPRGSRAAVELLLGASAMPAVVVNGNLEVKGNPTVTGPAGSIHANGTLLLSGNPCTHVYYASVAGTTESGNVQGGTACTAADVDARPFSPPINVPKLTPYEVAVRAQAAGFAVTTLSFVGNTGKAYSGLPAAAGTNPPAGAEIAWPQGWEFKNNGKTWESKGQTAAGTYYVIGNADVTANTEGVGVPNAAISVLAEGSISANGNPDVIPHSNVPFIGPILMIAGHDLDLGATFDAAYEGLFYARHQLDIKGSPTLNGQVIALNEADVAYQTKNPVTKSGGVMVIAGNPTINYTGNGLQSVRALTWRECRGNWAGATFAGGVMTDPGHSCGAP